MGGAAKKRRAAICICLSLISAIVNSMPAGTLTADYYYLSMREFVEPEHHHDMETMLIELYNAKYSRLNNITWLMHLTPLTCILLAQWQLFKISK